MSRSEPSGVKSAAICDQSIVDDNDSAPLVATFAFLPNSAIPLTPNVRR